MIDVFALAVNTFLVHVVPCSFSCVSLWLFATLKLLLVFFFVWSWFVHIWHERYPICIYLIQLFAPPLGERKAHLAYPR